jgi:hypothetical protein
MKRTRRFALGLAMATLLAAGTFAVAQEPPGPGEAHRALVRFSEGTFELVSLTPLSTVLPPSDGLPGEVGAISGFWFEKQDAQGEVVYRRIIGDPVRVVFEGPAEDPGVEPERVSPLRTPSDRQRDLLPVRGENERVRKHALSLARSAGGRFIPLQGRASTQNETLAEPQRDEAIPLERHFTLLIPAALDGEQLVLFSSPIAAGTQAEPAGEVARFVLQVTPPARGGAQ